MKRNHFLRGRFHWIILGLFAAALIGLFSLILTDASRAEELEQGTEEYCLSCHSNPDLSMTLPSGEQLPLTISPEEIKEGVHSPLGIECQACHTDISTYPHPDIEYDTKRELSRLYYLSCRKCHSENYEETQDSMHAEAAEAGNLNAPICTDCHGAHVVRPPNQPRGHISEICGQCHTEILKEYKNSIHGSALLEEDNPDVPVCTDCHGVHEMPDPRTAQFHIESPELCAGCHADPELMSKYGLSADVYDIYRTSWHGVDVAVFQARWPNLWHSSAVCTDCHGVHDMLSTDNPDSRVNPDNLLSTCQQCHPDAGPNFTGAWTGHYKISLQRTPFVFYTEAFYSSFTPFVLWLSGAYVILQVIRATVARIRRSL